VLCKKGRRINWIYNVRMSEIQIYTLAERDNYVRRIEDQILAKREMLVKKRHYLDNIMHSNRFLQRIRNDYAKYNDYIRREKEEQLRAMQLLHQYTKDLEDSGERMEKDFKVIQRDSDYIMNEIGTLRTQLNDLVDPK
jgi:hypothetical protein